MQNDILRVGFYIFKTGLDFLQFTKIFVYLTNLKIHRNNTHQRRYFRCLYCRRADNSIIRFMLLGWVLSERKITSFVSLVI